MSVVMLRIQRALNHWFESLILEDRYRYLARRGRFEAEFDERLVHYRNRNQYGAVRLAFSEARERMRRRGV